MLRDADALVLKGSEPRWYAAYTRANHEKRVASQIQERSIEQFLPLYSSERKWKDRRVHLQLPLFPGYVFVRIGLADRLGVLQIPGVARLVGFNGQPYPLADSEIEAIQACLLHRLNIEPHPNVRVGQRVRVKAGPLQGFEGVVTRRSNRLRVVISLALINRSAAVEIPMEDLEAVSRK